MPICSPLSSAAPPEPALEAVPAVSPAGLSRPGSGERHLARAFAGFAAAAVSLERSYTQLQAELARLRHQLEDRNRALARSLEENRSLSRHLDGILEGLPCGVLLIEPDQRIAMANPGARRLIGALCGRPGAPLEPPAPGLQQLITQALGGATEAGEREYRCAAAREGGGAGAEVEWIAARPAPLTTSAGRSSVLILRDLTAAKQLEAERERIRCRQALAEMSGVLAHEMRNPLGSLELFAGLLAGWGLEEQPRKWAEQLQAGLRFLAATVNNVLRRAGAPPPTWAVF
jgi:nitrogen fixation/metabolism regulation signal transduction histidine kinase